MESANIAKAEKKIDVLTEKVGASEDGALWIKQCLDPFSDTPRRPVGFPDLITGNSVIQVIKQAKTFTFATASDCHMFMDTMETFDLLRANSKYVDSNTLALVGDGAAGVQDHLRGGLVVRSGPVGLPLWASSSDKSIPLPSKYTNDCSVRVIAKGFEVHNTTNKLNVGGSVSVYRDTSTIPYADNAAITSFAVGSDTISIAREANFLSVVPNTLAEVTLIPGSQAWEAKDGCYCVATMASQTNNPRDERSGLIIEIEPGSNLPTTAVYANMNQNATIGKPPQCSSNVHLFSPFFVGGAYFTGLPAGTELTVNTIHVIERFVDSNNEDLVVLAHPSPYYDPVAMEVYSKTAQMLPHGTKVKNNADGDWIKNVADVLGTFGVPGMPLVKAGVDLWNGFQSNKLPKNTSAAENARIQQLEAKLNRVSGAVVGSPSKSVGQQVGQRRRNQQQPPKNNGSQQRNKNSRNKSAQKPFSKPRKKPTGTDSKGRAL